MKKVTIRIIILFLLITEFHSVHIQAASNQETIDISGTLTDQVAIVLVIDNSNSMIEADADSNRFNVAQMILELLSEDDYFAIVTFNNTADPLIPMSKLSDEQRQTTSNILSAPPAAGGTTDYELALTQAEAEFAAVSDVNLRKFTVSEDGRSGQVISPGIIDVTVPEEIWPSSSSRNFDIQIANRGTYLEQLNIKIDGAQINEEPLNCPAGETVNYQIPFKFTTEEPTVSLEIESFYDASIVRVNQDEIRVNNMSEPGTAYAPAAAGTEVRDPDRDRADERQARWIQNALLFFAVVLAALLVGSIGLFIARHHLSKREIRIKLSGYLYYEHPDKKIGVISLSGFDPMKIRIEMHRCCRLEQI